MQARYLYWCGDVSNITLIVWDKSAIGRMSVVVLRGIVLPVQITPSHDNSTLDFRGDGFTPAENCKNIRF